MAGARRARARSLTAAAGAIAVLALAAAPTRAQDSGASPDRTARGTDGLEGTIVVANKPEDTVSFVDVATGRVLGTADTGPNPHELVMTSDGRTAVVTDYGGSSLSLFDVASRSRIGAVDLGAYTRPHGIVMLPGDTVVAVTSETRGAVVLVDLARRRVVGAAETSAAGSHMVAVTADGRTAWTGDMGSHTVSRLDLASQAKVEAFDAPETPEAVAVTPGGDRVFAGSNGTGRVTAFRTSDGARTTVGEGFGWPYRVFLTPGVRQIVVPDLGLEVVRVFDGDDYAETARLEFPGDRPQGLTLHPDGRHLFQSLSALGRIAVIDLEGPEVVGYLEAGRGPDGIGYSPIVPR